MSIKKKFLKIRPACKVTFSVPKESPDFKEVLLLGDINHWEEKKGVKMKLRKGHFTAILELPIDQEYQFRYLLNGKEWRNDEEADGYLPTSFGSENFIVRTFQ